MGLGYEINRAEKLVLTICSGLVTELEIRQHDEALKSDPDFSSDFNQIIDMRQITEFPLSVDEIQKVAAYETMFKAESRRAIVAQNDLLFGLSRMYEAFHQHSDLGNLRVFRDFAEAKSWALSR